MLKAREIILSKMVVIKVMTRILKDVDDKKIIIIKMNKKKKKENSTTVFGI